MDNLNYPIKSYRLEDQITEFLFCYLQKMYLMAKNKHHLGENGWKKVSQADGTKEKQALIS